MDGKDIPLEIAAESDGTIVMVKHRGAWRAAVLRSDGTLPDGSRPPAGWPRFHTHWERCPDARSFRRQKRDRPGFLTSVYGPCRGCARPDHVRYGPSGSPLCDDCRPNRGGHHAQ